VSVTFYAARVTEDAEGRIIDMVSDLDHLSVNVSNANACAILDRLGFEAELWGEVAAEDFLGRAMVANVGRFDDGIESSSDRGQGGAVMIDCGLRPGYFDDRLSSLAELASAAAARGLLVGWA
jgi:hypothetical protein